MKRVLVEELHWIEFTTACERDGITKLFNRLKMIEVMVSPDYAGGKKLTTQENRVGQLDAGYLAGKAKAIPLPPDFKLHWQFLPYSLVYLVSVSFLG